MNHYWGSSNTIPASSTQNNNYFSGGGNNVTIRGNEIMERLPSQTPSQNMVQASMKTLRFYRKFCRLIPFILRIHNIGTKFTAQQAMINFGNYIRERNHYRDPGLIDHRIQLGYELLYEAEMHFSQHTILMQYLSPYNTPLSDRGYSYLEKVKYGNKSKFLQGFYKGNKPTEF
ncbi:NADH dehydrogenase, putative (macronuclear) [Tetrahymena thermophila SB210]|uniref:NADH dehydrogenase, putative n=1 Tax=Tetrahymena thermophila (strain SB210) TaxID=312017 RepID=I7M2Y3_TETTS|nr:NADH dehydrogenase, putative [Tetrahymena thermophila SB210]7TGH_A6 Chain A6, NADH dehydrogenase, putative [Tetrahymena thermophila]8B6F_AS Chain AS, NADH dehydrogenase, putative [Tetrahymena thermophila SB210]8BQS_AS Chain AS, NADH dehydrogenase, putative [Tetrahymena thermophila SB210]8GYM_A6 Chain A6, NADH dehydrogenase, putative [Tetrahymena thermophila SB210]8GYM_a6 Chain a6, NADH dehydrogenase, putative [Tetrahymena thermophila SB210]8GZU_A6 Chain A6, NADH dehydrogenase, putative [Te|eukprot:XP_001021863.1 NADH dehydrogenase, putative [Tetrahymena thermophila SB210]